jgi:hypothetical protein
LRYIVSHFFPYAEIVQVKEKKSNSRKKYFFEISAPDALAIKNPEP